MLRNAPGRIQMGERHQRARRREEEARHKKALRAAKRQWSGLEIISVHSDDGEVVSIIL